MSKVLEVKNVTKIYKKYKNNIDRLKEIFFKKKYHKEFISNDKINFDLYTGETLGIIGVNGAGKSTILKIIAGVTDATSGKVIKRGRVTALLELGTGFNYELTGYKNIFLNGTLIGLSKQECENNLQNIINFSELGDYIYEPIKTYSSGMKMRLAFSIAIFSSPDILIVDEALSVGDAHFSAKCTKMLAERKKQNMSIIYVSHDLNSLKLLCDRVILINKGKIQKDGTPENVINSYNYLISKLNDKDNKVLKNDSIGKCFGTFELKIQQVQIVGENTQSDIINSGENAIITATIKSNININDITVGILIKDKFGQEIFGTNTNSHNITLSFEKDKTYQVIFTMPLNIGIGKYSITTAIHTNDTHLDNCYHWLENACSFEVAGILGNRFIGLSRLDPKIKILTKGNI